MRLFVGRRQGRHVREVQIQPANEPLLQIPIYHRRLLTPLRPFQSITFGPHEGGTPHEPCAPGGQPFPNRNSPSAALRNLAIAREMQKSVYTHMCIHPAWNPSYSRSSPIRRVVGSWRRSGQASAPCTRSWKPWTFSSRASRGTFASSTRQGSCACGRRGKSASTRCARSHSASSTNGCDNTAACGRPASTGSAPSSIDDRRRGQENAGRRTHDKQPEGGEEQPCGWLKDKFGVSWQIVPFVLGEMMGDSKSGNSAKVMEALLKMSKIDIKTLRRAYAQRK